MLSRSSFSIIGGTLVILGVLIAVEPITAAPFDAEIVNRGGNSDHRDLAKRITVTTLEECYAACDSLFPQKRDVFSFSTYQGCKDGCSSHIKAPQAGVQALTEQPSEGNSPTPTSSISTKTSTSTEAAPSASASVAEPRPTQGGDAQAFVDAHNAARAKYHAPPVRWNDELAAFAAEWADKCIWGHSGGPYGENLAGGTTMPPQSAVDMWVGEASLFDFASGGFSSATGHFTQVVWVATTEIGCATKFCDGSYGTAKDYYVVCSYKAAGNVQDAYRENVLSA